MASRCILPLDGVNRFKDPVNVIPRLANWRFLAILCIVVSLIFTTVALLIALIVLLMLQGINAILFVNRLLVMHVLRVSLIKVYTLGQHHTLQ